MVRMGQCKTDHEDGMAPGGGWGRGSMTRGWGGARVHAHEKEVRQANTGKKHGL